MTTDAPLLALIASVALETDPVRRRLDDMQALTVGRKPAWTGSLGGSSVILVAAGMGKANAGQALAALLETHSLRGILGFGVGGAYAGSGIEPGGLALATSETYGDEGVQAPGGWLSTEAIGIPLLDGAAGPCFNEFPLSATRVEKASRSLTVAGIDHATGPFVTVSACSGTSARGNELAARFSAICESMEGAAYAHVAALYEVPFLELRSISNLVEDRDITRWKLVDAAEMAARAVEAIVKDWSLARD